MQCWEWHSITSDIFYYLEESHQSHLHSKEGIICKHQEARIMESTEQIWGYKLCSIIISSLPSLLSPSTLLSPSFLLLHLSHLFLLLKLITVTERCRCSVHMWKVNRCSSDAAQPQLQVHNLRTNNWLSCFTRIPASNELCDNLSNALSLHYGIVSKNSLMQICLRTWTKSEVQVKIVFSWQLG